MSDDGQGNGHHALPMTVLLKAYLRPILRFALAFLLFVFGLYLLQFSLALHPFPRRAGKPEVVLDHLPDKVKTADIQLSGHYQAWRRLDVSLNGHPYSTVWTSGDGTFKENISLARRANAITVCPLSEDGKADRDALATARITFSGDPAEPPAVSHIIEASPENDLLVGTMDADSALLVETISGHTAGIYSGDPTGTFAWQVPVDMVRDPEQYVAYFGPRAQGNVSFASIISHAAPASISRSIGIEFHDATADFHLEVKAPLKLPQIQRLVTGELSDEEFIRSIFGEVSPVPTDIPSGGASPRRSVVASDTEEADVRFTFSLPFVAGQRDALQVDVGRSGYVPLSRLSLSPSYQGLGKWPLLTPQDSFAVRFRDLHFDWTKPLPARLDAEEVSWRGPLPAVEVAMASAAAASPRQEPPGSPSETGARQTLTVREVLDDLQFPELTSTVALTLIRSIPFVWLLLLLRVNKALLARDGNGGWRGRPRTAAVCLVLTALSVWFVFYRISDGLRSVIRAIPGSAEHLRGGDPTTVFLALFLSFLVILRPFTMALDETAEKWLSWSGLGVVPPAASWKRWSDWVAGAVFILAIAFVWRGPGVLGTLAAHGVAPHGSLVVAGFVRSWNVPLWVGVLSLIVAGLSGWGVGAGCAAFCALAISMVSVAVLLSPGATVRQGLGPAIMGAVADRMGPVSVAILLYALTLIVVMWLSYALIPRRLVRFSARALFIVALGVLVPTFSVLPPRWTDLLSGFLLVAIAAWLLYYVALISPGFQAWLETGSNSRILWVSAAAVAIVLIVPQGARSGPGYTGQGFFSLLNELIYFWAYVPLAGVLVWLHRRHREHQAVPPAEELQLAYFLFSVYLVGYSANWFFLPLPMIIGYALAKLWLLPDAPASLGAGDAASVKGTLAELVRRRANEKLAGSVRKGLDKKLEGGQIDLEDYRKGLAELPAGASEPGQPDEGRGRDALLDKALASGPTGADWSNAMLALRYAFPLSLIPSALAMYEFAAGQETPFPALTFALRMVLSFAYWLVLAFFFGYFYRFIKGKSGLAKGLYLAAAVTFPYLCIRLMETQSLLDFRYYFFWAMQVFAFCTILGLFCFDYETLRRNGFSLGDLLAVHDAPILSAFASSVIAVVVPSVVALAKGEVLDLVKFLTERILPSAK